LSEISTGTATATATAALSPYGRKTIAWIFMVVAAVTMLYWLMWFAIPGGRDALARMVVGPPPDLLVLDLRMPELDGRALLREVRARGLRPRTILLSADRAVAQAAEELGAEAFVEKPFSPAGLLAAVRRTSRSAADSRPQIRPITRGRKGGRRLRSAANRPSPASVLRSRSSRASRSPTPTCLMSTAVRANEPRVALKSGFAQTTTRAPGPGARRIEQPGDPPGAPAADPDAGRLPDAELG